MSPEQRVEFGHWLRSKRDMASLSKIAEDMQCSMSAWQRYEKGERPIPLELLLRIVAAYSDVPDYAIPDIARPGNMSPNVRAQRVASDDGGTYKIRGNMREFESRLEIMRRAQSVVTQGLNGYGLPPPQHITFHQLLTHLIVQQYVTPEGVAELIQWYAFEQKPGVKK